MLAIGHQCRQGRVSSTRPLSLTQNQSGQALAAGVTAPCMRARVSHQAANERAYHGR